MSAPSAVGLGIVPDAELQRVLDIAALVGDIGHDEVNVSYTSLLIGLMWSDDATSRWLQEQQQALGVKIDAIYGHRLVTASQKDPILKAVRSGTPASPRRDFYSISAKTVLREAVSLAQETGTYPQAPLGARHLAAVYLFRNPPGHNPQLHQEWGFDQQKWRKAFARFIAAEYKAELSDWTDILAGCLDDIPDKNAISGETFKGYHFEPQTVQVLRAMELLVASANPPVFSSERLLETLVGIRELADCAIFADMVADRMKIKSAVSLSAEARPFGESDSQHAATHGFKAILARSRTLTRSITGGDEIGIRHIIASILVVPDSTANQRLTDSGVRLPLVREKLLREFTRRWFNDDGVQWRFALVGSTPPTIAGFHSDSADKGDDRLDVTRYARAFAIVLAAEKVTPPVSIGIFGDWGSGKSFFMRLMSEQTDALAGSEAKGPDGRRLFCRRVVPIRFNAWHYAEVDLWASLVQTILQELRTAIVGKTGDESEVMDRILENLEVAKTARKEAQDALDKAKEEQKAREGKLKAAQAAAAEKVVAVQQVRARDILAAVRDQSVPDTQTLAAVQVAEKYLHVEGAGELAAKTSKNVGEVENLLSDVRVTAARSYSSFEWLLRAPVAWHEMALLGVAAVAVLGLGAAINAAYPKAWTGFYSAIAEAGAILGVALPWARRNLRTVSSGLGQFESLRKTIDTKLAEQRRAVDADAAVAEKELADSVAAVERLSGELKTARERVAQAEREVEESRSVNRIARLLDQRLNGKSYEQYLGIVAAIRADFEKISTLMKTMRREEQTGTSSLNPVDRIVLYIDDLDRCPSDKVVRVLEAIHLLLAFELFVVVVGVDIRWAARSLAEKYPRHLAAGVFNNRGDAALQAGDRDCVSALDYLEKIFQIPFWLPPMEEDASRNMISEMVPRALEATSASAALAGARESSAHQDASNERTADPIPLQRSLPGETAKPQLLAIETEERNFMLGLAAAVGKSPRRLKRFVNTYRVLKASLDRLQRESFDGQPDRPGEYRSAMVLLALVTAAPRSSLELLQFLSGCKDGDLFEAFEQQVKQATDASERQYAEAALAAYRAHTSDTPLTVGELRTWAPQVARFSFQSVRA